MYYYYWYVEQSTTDRRVTGLYTHYLSRTHQRDYFRVRKKASSYYHPETLERHHACLPVQRPAVRFCMILAPPAEATRSTLRYAHIMSAARTSTMDMYHNSSSSCSAALSNSVTSIYLVYEYVRTCVPGTLFSIHTRYIFLVFCLFLFVHFFHAKKKPKKAKNSTSLGST